MVRSVRTRLPFARKDALQRLLVLREMVVDDAARHEELCAVVDCADRQLRMELVLILNEMVMAHGGSSLFSELSGPLAPSVN